MDAMPHFARFLAPQALQSREMPRFPLTSAQDRLEFDEIAAIRLGRPKAPGAKVSDTAGSQRPERQNGVRTRKG